MIFFAIILLIVLVLYGISNREGFTEQKIWATTFGGGGQNYYDAVDRINSELTNVNAFDKIILYYDTDLKKDNAFWSKHHKFIEHNTRGYGYWLWKPYLILKTLEKMNDNDILFYLDAGCEVINNENSYGEIMNMIEKCNQHNILYTLTGQYEKKYTKMDLFKYMNYEVDDSIQNQATFIIIKKNKLMVDFVKEWYNISCNYHYIDDSPSNLPNDITFIEHRHDQSIFSLLIKNNKLNDNDINPEPFLLSRKRNG